MRLALSSDFEMGAPGDKVPAGKRGMHSLSVVTLLTSFGAGIVSFLSPCVLPLVPGYVSYLTGGALSDRQQSAEPRLAALPLGLCFVLGFSTVFVVLGASATTLGRLFLSYRYEANLAAGAIVILFGLFIIGFAKLPWLQRDLRFHLDLPGGRPVAAYVIGAAFHFGWTPCVGPVLGTILTASAVSATVRQGVLLLGLYSLGLGLPFLAATFFTEALAKRLRHFRRAGALLQIAAGTVVFGFGAAMLTGELTRFSYWLLDTFPILARLG